MSDKSSVATNFFDRLPNRKLMALLATAYSPCRHFGACKEARWDPASGHIPRGYLGATAALEGVELVMVFSEPGHPHIGEEYGHARSPEAFIRASVENAYECFKNGKDLFHCNARWFVDQVYPDLTFDEQLQRIWLTEGRLCSIDREIGHTKDNICASKYLTAQLDLMPQATVIAFGNKAKHYLKCVGVDCLHAYALAPPGANHKPARPSWEIAISEFKRRRAEVRR